jgi:hypothetical protein
MELHCTAFIVLYLLWRKSGRRSWDQLYPAWRRNPRWLAPRCHSPHHQNRSTLGEKFSRWWRNSRQKSLPTSPGYIATRQCYSALRRTCQLPSPRSTGPIRLEKLKKRPRKEKAQKIEDPKKKSQKRLRKDLWMYFYCIDNIYCTVLICGRKKHCFRFHYLHLVRNLFKNTIFLSSFQNPRQTSWTRFQDWTNYSKFSLFSANWSANFVSEKKMHLVRTAPLYFSKI